MFSRLGVMNAFSTFTIFSLQWVYQDIIPRWVKEHLYSLQVLETKDWKMCVSELLWVGWQCGDAGRNEQCGLCV